MGFAVYETKYGPLKIEHNESAVTLFTVLSSPVENMGTRTPLTELAYQQWKEYLNGNRFYLDFPTEYHGTPFQEAVWETLKSIPYGETRSYKEIAMQIGRPKAFRAVGQANHCNPLIIIIPCHRVIGSNGKPVGYACGVDMKTDLLNMEKKARNPEE